MRGKIRYSDHLFKAKVIRDFLPPPSELPFSEMRATVIRSRTSTREVRPVLTNGMAGAGLAIAQAGFRHHTNCVNASTSLTPTLR